jgi:predicted RecA/RadA family phage recombinase
MPIKRTIIAMGEGERVEYEAASAISPGDLVIVNSAGKVLRHATAATKPGHLYAIENEIFGKGTDVDYAAADRVLCEACKSGMQVNVTIAASALAIAIGDFLESAGDGTLRRVALAATAMAVAEEAVDNSAGVTKTRVRARLI